MCCVTVETHRLDTRVQLNDQQALVVGSVEWSVRGVGIMALGDMANDRYLINIRRLPNVTVCIINFVNILSYFQL